MNEVLPARRNGGIMIPHSISHNYVARLAMSGVFLFRPLC